LSSAPNFLPNLTYDDALQQIGKRPTVPMAPGVSVASSRRALGERTTPVALMAPGRSAPESA
jgi:hypothetical protein